jgi:Lrp/AsnC family leucine-responsive transcriptional regulator
MDRVDKKILELLQTNSRINNQELAEKVALSPSPCLRRVKQLEETGYITHYVALLNPTKIGLTLTIIIFVGLSSHNHKIMSNFEKIIESSPEVMQCYLIAGQSADYMLRVVVTNLAEYQEFLLNKLTQIEGVNSVQSSFVVKNIVEKTALPLDILK